MASEVFRAAVQYGDMKGTASLDHHDQGTATRYLEGIGALQPDELVVAIEMWSGEVHDTLQLKPVYVTFLVGQFTKYETFKDAAESGKPVQLRAIKCTMKLEEFFGLFKRFSVKVSTDGLLTGKEINYPD